MGQYFTRARSRAAPPKSHAGVGSGDLYDRIDGTRFPNLKQMLRGLRNYQVLSFNRQVSDSLFFAHS